ncbi:MAG: hypothetical protein ABR498_06300 [Candidatus Dormibacteria bacterium]
MSAAALRRGIVEHHGLLIVVIVVAITFIRVVIVADALMYESSSGDIGRYYEIATGGIPYRDQAVEYPPMAVLVIDALHAVAPARHAFGLAVIVMMALADVMLCVLMWRTFGPALGTTFLVVDTLLFVVLITRMDVLPTLLAAVFMIERTRRPVAAAFSWVLAVGLKLWPVVLGVFMLDRTTPRRRAVITGLIGCAVLSLSWVLLAGGKGLGDVVTYRGAHGWQMESVVGAVLRTLTKARVQIDQGAARLGTVPPVVGPALLALGAAAGLALSSLATRRGQWGTGWLAGVLCLLVTSTLLSPQFLVWATPGAALALFETRAAMWAALAFIAAAGLTTLEYNLYGSLFDGDASVQALLLIRNALLIAALALAVRALTGPGDVRHWQARLRPERLR